LSWGVNHFEKAKKALRRFIVLKKGSGKKIGKLAQAGPVGPSSIQKKTKWGVVLVNRYSIVTIAHTTQRQRWGGPSLPPKTLMQLFVFSKSIKKKEEKKKRETLTREQTVSPQVCRLSCLGYLEGGAVVNQMKSQPTAISLSVGKTRTKREK